MTANRPPVRRLLVRRLLVRRLLVRLLTVIGPTLAALAAPLPGPQRVGLLGAFAAGLVGGSKVRELDRWAVWLVGPAVLVLALAPPAGLWAVAALAAVAVLGMACQSESGAERALPALGLPLFTIAFRSGQDPSGLALAAWIGAVVALLALVNQAEVDPSGPPRGAGSARRWIAGRRGGRAPNRWRPTLEGLAVVALAVPVALAAAGVALDRIGSWSPNAVGSPVAGSGSGTGPAGTHPGLTGGLDTGTPVTLDDDVVLRVKAPRARFWRGTTYEHWDGRFWSSGARLTPIALDESPLTLDQPLVGPGNDGTSGPASGPERGPAPAAREIEVQEFTAVGEGLDVLVGAWRMSSIRTTPQSGLLGDDGSIALFAPLSAGSTWVVSSEVVPASPDELRRADPLELPAGSPFMDRFATEDAITPEVAALARDVTAGAATTYDRILALETWIEEHITYTRDIDPLPQGADAVHHLLFESRRGYCEQIASALAVMLRSLGVPTRVVVGYVPGGWDENRGEWVSRGTDAHAWAEVWFPGVGWQGFDPTAGVPYGAEASAPTSATTAGSPALTSPGLLTASMAVAVVAVVAVPALVAVRSRSSQRASRAAVHHRDRSLALLRNDFDRCGRRLALAWAPGVTLRERARDLDRAGVAPDAVEGACSALERAWYGPPADTDDLRPAHDAMGRLEQAVRGVGPGAGVRAMRAVRYGSGRDRWRWSTAARRDRAPRSSPSRSRAR